MAGQTTSEAPATAVGLPPDPSPGTPEKRAEPLAIRPAGGGNCSSVGSVVDMLFLAGTLGGALLVAVNAALDAREQELASAPAKQDEEGAVEGEG